MYCSMVSAIASASSSFEYSWSESRLKSGDLNLSRLRVLKCLLDNRNSRSDDRYVVSNRSGYAVLISLNEYVVLDRKLDTPYPMEVDTLYLAINQNNVMYEVLYGELSQTLDLPVLNKEITRIEESLDVTFDESLPEPKSSPSIEDDRINKPIVQDLNGSPSVQVNVSDEGYLKSLKEARGHPIEQVIGELNEGTLSSSKSVLDNKALEDSSSNSIIDEDWYNVEDNVNDVVIPQTTSKEDRTWDKIGNSLRPYNIGDGYSISYENTMNMINSNEDLRKEN
ncbi:hypothetical protein Tco_0484347 [Tanacetum coccineum]